MTERVLARAAVVRERGGEARVEDVQVQAPGEGEARVRVAACGICASDLRVLRTGEGITFPAVLGHEAAGIVEALGPGVREPALGQRVVVAWTPRCGMCRACRAGRPYVCARVSMDRNDGSLTLDGQSLGRYMQVSGLAERIVVPARALVAVPHGLGLRTACLVGCGVMTGLGAVMNTAAVRRGEIVAVFGCGAVGLSAVQGARIAGAARIVAVDRDRARLDLAGRLGATDLLSSTDEDPVARIQALTDGGADVAIEAVGSGVVARQAFDALAPGGRAIVVGLTGFAEEIRLPLVALLLDKSIGGSIYGSADPPRDFPKAFALYEHGTLHLDEIGGPDYALEQVNEAFAALASGRAIRPRIVFDGVD